MRFKQKYIITKENRAIVFSELLQHSDFRHFEPIRAGFVVFNSEVYNPISCTVYGESISLNRYSNKKLDEDIIKREILGYSPFDL